MRHGKVVSLVCNNEVLLFDDLAGLGLGLATRMLSREDFGPYRRRTSFS